MKFFLILASVHAIEDQQRLIPGTQDYYDKSDSVKVHIEKVQAAFLDKHKIDSINLIYNNIWGISS